MRVPMRISHMKKLNLRGYRVGPFYLTGKRGIGPAPPQARTELRAWAIRVDSRVMVWGGVGAESGLGKPWWGRGRVGSLPP